MAYSAAGLNEEGAYSFVTSEEYKRLGVDNTPWDFRTKAEMVAAMDGAYSQAELVERIDAIAKRGPLAPVASNPAPVAEPDAEEPDAPEETETPEA